MTAVGHALGYAADFAALVFALLTAPFTLVVLIVSVLIYVLPKLVPPRVDRSRPAVYRTRYERALLQARRKRRRAAYDRTLPPMRKRYGPDSRTGQSRGNPRAPRER